MHALLASRMTQILLYTHPREFGTSAHGFERAGAAEAEPSHPAAREQTQGECERS